MCSCIVTSKSESSQKGQCLLPLPWCDISLVRVSSPSVYLLPCSRTPSQIQGHLDFSATSAFRGALSLHFWMDMLRSFCIITFFIDSTSNNFCTTTQPNISSNSTHSFTRHNEPTSLAPALLQLLCWNEIYRISSPRFQWESKFSGPYSKIHLSTLETCVWPILLYGSENGYDASKGLASLPDINCMSSKEITSLSMPQTLTFSSDWDIYCGSEGPPLPFAEWNIRMEVVIYIYLRIPTYTYVLMYTYV